MNSDCTHCLPKGTLATTALIVAIFYQGNLIAQPADEENPAITLELETGIQDAGVLASPEIEAGVLADPTVEATLVSIPSTDQAPTIRSPLNNYSYGDQFTVIPARDPPLYRIPVQVTMPYAASIVLDLQKISIHADQSSDMQPYERFVIDIDQLFNQPYGDGIIYAGNHAFTLPSGRYALYASGHVSNWMSKLSVVNFTVVDRAKLEENLASGKHASKLPATSPDIPPNMAPEAAPADIGDRTIHAKPNVMPTPGSGENIIPSLPGGDGNTIPSVPGSTLALSKQGIHPETVPIEVERVPTSDGVNQLPSNLRQPIGGYDTFTVISPVKGQHYALVPTLRVFVPERVDILYSLQRCEKHGVNCDYYINPANNDIDWRIPAGQLQCSSGDSKCSINKPFDMPLAQNRAYMLAIMAMNSPAEPATLVPFEVGSFAEASQPELMGKHTTTQAGTVAPVFGSKAAALSKAPKALSGPPPGGMAPATRGIGIKNKPAPVVAVPQGGMAPAMTGQPLTKAPAMKPLSGPAPTLQPPSLARAPAVAAPVPMTTRQRVDTTSQKAPVTAAQPGLKRQVALARPVIAYPKMNAIFTAPASFTVKAKLISGKSVKYALRLPGQIADYKKNSTGQFSNVKAGNYCVYVAYDQGGPVSDCVPFSVRLAMKKAPAMRTAPKPTTQPAPTITPKPVSPVPMKKTIPAPMAPGG